MNNNAKGNSSPSTEAHAVKSEIPHQEPQRRRFVVLLAVFLLAVIIWLIPPPSGVQPRAWHMLAIFVATIVGIITKPLPMGAIAGIRNCCDSDLWDANHQPGSKRLREQHNLADRGRLFHFPRNA